MLKYAPSQSNKIVQHAFMREFSKQSQTAMQISTWYTKSKEKGWVCRRKRSRRQKTSEETVDNVHKKNLAKPKEIVTKNKSGNPDSTDNSLAHPEEVLDNETLQAITRSGHIGRGQAKTQTELTCAVSQAKRILNMCENDYEIHISPKFSIKSIVQY